MYTEQNLPPIFECTPPATSSSWVQDRHRLGERRGGRLYRSTRQSRSPNFSPAQQWPSRFQNAPCRALSVLWFQSLTYVRFKFHKRYRCVIVPTIIGFTKHSFRIASRAPPISEKCYEVWYLEIPTWYQGIYLLRDCKRFGRLKNIDVGTFRSAIFSQIYDLIQTSRIRKHVWPLMGEWMSTTYKDLIIELP